MITFVDYTQGRPAGFAMLTLPCDGPWLRALPEFTGGVAAQAVTGTDVHFGDISARTRLVADVYPVPGLPAWSPPT